jgi:RHS repeat-associated protein
MKHENNIEDNHLQGFYHYFHANHLGSTSLITNLDGEVVQHIECVPFGEVFIEERNNTWNTPYLFNAKELDEETGLYYYGARYYDSRVSLWVSADPKQEDYPNISTYAYCANNPVMFVDPDGNALILSSQKINFYNTIGTSAIQAAVAIGVTNKFKGLYIVAQRRIENGFNPTPPANNPMNIKGKGDLGTSSLMTIEYIGGVRTKLPQNFAKFSSVEKGFEGYMNLLKSNFSDAYDALLDNSKSIVDFANGLQNGRLGKYATDPNYIEKLTSMFNNIVSDYKRMLNTDLNYNNALIKQYKSEIDNLHEMGNDDTNPLIIDRTQRIEGLRSKNVVIERDIKSLNDIK